MTDERDFWKDLYASERELLAARRELTELREAQYEVGREVEAYLSHRHRQHEWRCDETECPYLARLVALSHHDEVTG